MCKTNKIRYITALILLSLARLGMSGGNLERSCSLLDLNQRERVCQELVFQGRDTSGTGWVPTPTHSRDGNQGISNNVQRTTQLSRSLNTIPQPSEEEGLVLLGDKSQEADAVMSPAEVNQSLQQLLDYDSDSIENKMNTIIKR